ncbi:helix-turn-helix domain-containing protein [Lacinutrix neustonica]|uniref:Helix-turn-helix domain-containing protein n=1 Tax=Lacinutrix neustonica TaxID=2980107 RepID=A0A9E8MTX4_9FLAO|nr:helix-turn-helix domain-containing protein [Lacinutrix neustonica]WAC01021.1 helix-turn-helix domain-containing protein [Lacinutrix neustonica]
MAFKNKSAFLFLAILFVIVASCKKEDLFKEENQHYRDQIKKTIYNNPNKAITLSDSFLIKSKSINNVEGIILSNTYKAVAYDVLNILDSTIHYYKKTLKSIDNPIDIIQYKYSIARIYERQYKYQNALDIYIEALILAKKKNFISVIEVLRSAIKEIEYILLDNEKALHLYLVRYNETKGKIGNTDLKFNRKNLIQAYLKANKIDAAFNLIKEGILEADDNKNLEFQYYLYELEARAYIKKQELLLAINSIHEATKKAILLGNIGFQNEAKYTTAVIKGKQGKYDEQIELLKSIIEKTAKNKTAQLTKYYKLLAEAYKSLGENDLHINYRDKYDAGYSKISKEKSKIISNIHKVFLEEEKQETKQQILKKWYWVTAFIVLFCVSTFVYLRNKKTQKRNKKLFNELMLKVDAYEKENVPVVENTKSKIKGDEVNSVAHEALDEETSSIYIIDDEKVNEILVKLKNLEDQQYFLRQDCTLHNMAKRLKTNTSYLSKVVNNHLNKTFSTYINELRINYAIIELKKNKQLRAYSTKAIAQELGYKKANSFSKYFKEATGITPAVYIKNIKELS